MNLQFIVAVAVGRSIGSVVRYLVAIGSHTFRSELPMGHSHHQRHRILRDRCARRSRRQQSDRSQALRGQPHPGRQPRIRGAPQSPVKLVDHDVIAFESIDATNEWRFKPNDSIRVTPRLTVNNADATVAAAEAGIGITRTLSHQVRDSGMAGRLVPILQKSVPPPSPLSAIYPARRVVSANVAAFIRIARNHFAASPLVPVQKLACPGRGISGSDMTRRPSIACCACSAPVTLRRLCHAGETLLDRSSDMGIRNLLNAALHSLPYQRSRGFR